MFWKKVKDIRQLVFDLEATNRRIDALERMVIEKHETHKGIEKYYVSLINDKVKEATKAAVAEMLHHPIEMTIEDIEKAFNHKVKIVG